MRWCPRARSAVLALNIHIHDMDMDMDMDMAPNSSSHRENQTLPKMDLLKGPVLRHLRANTIESLEDSCWKICAGSRASF